MNGAIINNTSSCDDNIKNILVKAAAFEEEFSIDWLALLSKQKPSLILEAIEAGIQEGILQKITSGIFKFKSQTKREKLSAHLDANDKENLHREIADLLKRELPADSNQIKAIAQQYLHVKNELEGCQYLVDASNLFYQENILINASKYLLKAIQDLSLLHSEDSDALFVKAVMKYAGIYWIQNDIDQTISFIKDAIVRAESLNMKDKQALLEMNCGAYEWSCFRLEEGETHFIRAQKMADEYGGAGLAKGRTNIRTLSLYGKGNFREAIKQYEISQPDVEQVLPDGFPLLAAETVGNCYVNVGQVAYGLAMIEAVRQRHMKRDNFFLAAESLFQIGRALLNANKYDEAIRYLEESHKLNIEGRHVSIFALTNLALAYAFFFKGDKDKSLNYLESYIKLGRGRLGNIVDQFGYILALCWEMEEDNLPKLFDLEIEKVITIALGKENIFLKGLAYRFDALFREKKQQSYERVLKSLIESQKLLEISGHKIELARTLLELARFYLMKGQETKAQEIKEMISAELSFVGEDFIPTDLEFIIKKEPLREELLESILKLGQDLVAIRGHKDLIQRILSLVNSITGAERSAIFLKDNDSYSFTLRASKNITADEISRPEFASSIKILEEAFRRADHQLQTKGSPEEYIVLDGNQKHFRMCVPMLFRDEVTGVLYFDNRIFGHSFKKLDYKVLLYFASQIAIALDNANAYAKIEQLNEELQEEKQYYKEENLQETRFGELVGKSPAIKNLYDQINRVSGIETNVLITGETGVGKELVARAIHNRSPRSEKPFVRVHCSALPENLIPSELFGHEKGAFTGAINRRVGRFELANGGSLFLDEIGELSQDVQVRLLRVLQTKEFERVGGSQTIQSDFRLIAATNRNLEAEVKAGRFRSDLYYRLNVFPIYVPPLRDRIDDIPLLTDHFLTIHGARLGKPSLRISKFERSKLMNYLWPGNIRELENIIERGIILSSDTHFHMPELDVYHPDANVFSLSGGITIMENERRHILWTLKKTNWKVHGSDGAAALLDMKPTTLYSRMKKLGIKKEQSKINY